MDGSHCLTFQTKSLDGWSEGMNFIVLMTLILIWVDGCVAGVFAKG